jgi:HD-GYP domain-containing protein (c-di-GMP phosphodiesterase class II)
MPHRTSQRSLLPRLRILWMVLGALLLVSVVPILLYHRQVLELSQEKLEDTERLQQAGVTRSLAEEIHLFESSLDQQLTSQIQILNLNGALEDVDAPAHSAQVTARLEDFVKGNPDILYVTALNRKAKGPWSGNFRADADPFVKNALERGMFTCSQGAKFRSDPLAAGKENSPAFVVAVPLEWKGEPAGMLAALVSLERIQGRLREATVRGREVYIVDRKGVIVAHPDQRRWVAGADASTSFRIVAQLRDLPRELRATQTTRFQIDRAGRRTEMIGTYSTVQDLSWAVIAQRSLDDARADAGVSELNRQALTFAAFLTLFALILGYMFAVGITTPIRSLAESTLAISRGEFHQRAPVQGAAEISDLAETFNRMAGDIEQFIEQLKQAAEENRELFVGSIRMLAAAIDEKDPYTRGHSGRVSKYSTLIGEAMGLGASDLDRLRISALLHDVGKIGIDDRVLKKPGSLTDEEFQIMKQHPVKGANIMRPVAQLKDMLPGIELHHEQVNGKGYPYGLQGEQIPLMARIISVADTLDAITTNRPYQSAMDIEFALRRVRELTGTRFDSKVVDALELAIKAGKLKLSATLVEV